MSFLVGFVSSPLKNWASVVCLFCCFSGLGGLDHRLSWRVKRNSFSFSGALEVGDFS